MSRFAYRAGRRHSGGFSLIELMIALVLGLLVLGAAIAVFQSNQRTFNANEGQNRIQEGARAGLARTDPEAGWREVWRGLSPLPGESGNREVFLKLVAEPGAVGPAR